MQLLKDTSTSLEVTIKFSSCNTAKKRRKSLFPISPQEFYLHASDVTYYILSHAMSGGGSPQPPTSSDPLSPSSAPTLSFCVLRYCLQLQPSLILARALLEPLPTNPHILSSRWGSLLPIPFPSSPKDWLVQSYKAPLSCLQRAANSQMQFIFQGSPRGQAEV